MDCPMPIYDELPAGLRIIPSPFPFATVGKTAMLFVAITGRRFIRIYYPARRD